MNKVITLDDAEAIAAKDILKSISKRELVKLKKKAKKKK